MTSMLKSLINHRIKIVFGMLVFALGLVPCFAQTNSDMPNQQATSADQQIPSAIAKELDAMRKRIDELEAELKNAKTPDQPSTSAAPTTSTKATVPTASFAAAPAAPAAPVNTAAESSTAAKFTAEAAPPA